MPPQNDVVPNVAFAVPYAHFSRPQQSMAIIGGYTTRNMQNIAAIQTNAAQLGEGNANIAYELGLLHLAPPEQFIGGEVQSYYGQWYNHQDYQYQPPADDSRGGALVFFPFPLFFNFQLVYAYICVVFSLFTLIFIMCVSFYFHHE
jgi:hypothetical protein